MTATPTLSPTGHYPSRQKLVAILIPCFNEEASIRAVVVDFRTALPDALVYVYDNNSTDDTVRVAREAGAIVRTESLQGKGNVVRRMFNDIEADIYVMVDGDNTYDASAAPNLIDVLVSQSLDMVVGKRVTEIRAAYRPGHRFGNALLTNMIRAIFGRGTTDMLSGYRVFSRRFVKSFPALSEGFQIETELTVHALELRLAMAEVETKYLDRPAGSSSKLRTYRDGVRILRLIAKLIKDERPFPFFGFISALFACVAIILVIPVISEYLSTGVVRRFPTAGLSAALMIVAALSFLAGVILDTVSHGRKEIKRLFYLQQTGVSLHNDARE